MTGNGKTRGKPKVAYESEATAKENIKLKLEIMRSALENKGATDADWKKILQDYPTTLRQFCAWNSGKLESNPKSAKFGTNAMRTLRRNDNLRAAVETAFVAIEARRNLKPSTPTKLESLARLKRELAEAVLLKNIAVRELVEERERSRREASTFASELAKAASAKMEAIRLAEKRKDELERLRKEIGPTRKGKVSPLRRGGTDD